MRIPAAIKGTPITRKAINDSGCRTIRDASYTSSPTATSKLAHLIRVSIGRI